MFKKKMITVYGIPEDAVKELWSLYDLFNRDSSYSKRYALWHYIKVQIPQFPEVFERATLCKEACLHPYVKVTTYVPLFDKKK